MKLVCIGAKGIPNKMCVYVFKVREVRKSSKELKGEV